MGKTVFAFIGIGEVVQDKEQTAWECNIFLKEHATFAEGVLGEDDKSPKTIKLKGGGTYQLAKTASNSIWAKWLPLCNGNRLTPPDLCKGETVMVCGFEGNDEYYWIKLFSEPDLAKRDVVTWLFSAKPDGNEGNEDTITTDYLTAAYRFTVDCEHKEIKLVTSDANEEVTIYSVQLDLEEGTFTIEDKTDNYLQLNSVENKWRIRAAANINQRADEERNSHIGTDDNRYVVGNVTDIIDGNVVESVTGNVTTVIQGNIEESVEGNSKSIVKGNVDLSAEGGLQIKSKGNIVVDGEGDIGITSLNGKLVIFSGSEITLFAPTINIMAPAVSVSGALTAAALNVGGAAGSPPDPLLAKIEKGEKVDLEEIKKHIIEENEIPQPEEEENNEEQEEEEEESKDEEEEENKEEEEEEEKEPEKPDTSTDQEDANMDLKGSLVVTAKKGVNFSATEDIAFETSGGNGTLKGTQILVEGTGSTTVKGSGGLSLQGASGDLMDLLATILDTICTALDLPHGTSAPGSPTTPPMQGAIAKEALKPLLTAFKGSARSISGVSRASLRARSLGLPEPEETFQVPPEVTKLLEDMNRLKEESLRKIEEMNKPKETNDDSSSN